MNRISFLFFVFFGFQIHADADAKLATAIGQGGQSDLLEALLEAPSFEARKAAFKKTWKAKEYDKAVTVAIFSPDFEDTAYKSAKKSIYGNAAFEASQLGICFLDPEVAADNPEHFLWQVTTLCAKPEARVGFLDRLSKMELRVVLLGHLALWHEDKRMDATFQKRLARELSALFDQKDALAWIEEGPAKLSKRLGFFQKNYSAESTEKILSFLND